MSCSFACCPGYLPQWRRERRCRGKSSTCWLTSARLLCSPSLPPHRPRRWLISGLAVYAAVLEAGQLYVPGRAAQGIDWAASALGAVLGVLAFTRLLSSQSAPASTGS